MLFSTNIDSFRVNNIQNKNGVLLENLPFLKQFLFFLCFSLFEIQNCLPLFRPSSDNKQKYILLRLRQFGECITDIAVLLDQNLKVVGNETISKANSVKELRSFGRDWKLS